MILLTVTHTMESILQQLTEMDVIQAGKELLTVGIAAGMKKEVCIESMDMVEKCVKNMLGRYL